MFRILCLISILLGGCHGWLGGRTTEEDQEINEFAEARQRAATYYEGRDYSRAAAQFKKALDIRPDHYSTKLGYAYSLMYTKEPANLVEAENQFNEIGVRKDKTEEVKRIYGLALTHRTLATRFDGQARYHDRKGMLEWRDKDIYNSRKHAREGIKLFKQVLDSDTALAKAQDAAPRRVSASPRSSSRTGTTRTISSGRSRTSRRSRRSPRRPATSGRRRPRP
jgi:tetratricopeptide (TPR) repeat protein